MVKVAINGFGRIGKKFFLAAIAHRVDWDIIINEPGDLDFVSYSLKYDSAHPLHNVKIFHDKNYLFFGNRKIKFYNILNASKLPWSKEKVDLVVDCSGHFTNAEDANLHIKAGAKKVLISAPAKGHDVTIIPGVNEKVLKKEHKIISAGSCTTNCISPMVKILNDLFHIKNAYFVTTHAYTATQKLIDGHDQKDPRRGRAAAVNITPATSGASQSVIESLPEIKVKLKVYALRVPVVNGSISSLIAEVEKKTSIDEINSSFRKKSLGEFKGILEYNEDPIVSTDIIGNQSSCIFDSTMTDVQGDLISIAGWYDNEIGYSNRLVNVAKLILNKG